MSDTRAVRLSDSEARDWQCEFPSLASTVHVANCSHGPQSRRVRSAVDAYLDSWLAEGMDWESWIAGPGEPTHTLQGAARLTA